MSWIRPCSSNYFFFIMAYKSVIRIKDKAFSQGENFHVGMKKLTADLTWKPDQQATFIPFVDDQGHNGMHMIVEPKEDN